MNNKEAVRKALETNIESIESTVNMRSSAIMSQGQLLLMLHKLKDYYPAVATPAKKELIKKPTTKGQKI